MRQVPTPRSHPGTAYMVARCTKSYRMKIRRGLRRQIGLLASVIGTLWVPPQPHLIRTQVCLVRNGRIWLVWIKQMEVKALEVEVTRRAKEIHFGLYYWTMAIKSSIEGHDTRC